MPNGSLWSDDDGGHAWIPAREEAAPEPAPPAEERRRPARARAYTGFAVQLVAAGVAGAVAVILIEVAR